MLNENQRRILLYLATNGECVYQAGPDYKEWRDLEKRGYIKGQAPTCRKRFTRLPLLAVPQ
jgi:hypothetical protein